MKKSNVIIVLLILFSCVNKINSQTVLFEENFTGGGDWAVINQPAKWINLTAEGSGRKWSTINQSTTPPVAFSYNRATAGSDNWLITAQPLNLTSPTNSFQFEFSFGWGYYVTGEPFRFQVLVTEAFDGVDPLKSTWTDITDEFITVNNVNGGGTATLNERVTTAPSGLYPGQRIYTTNLNGFRGKSVYIAFRDKLAPLKTSGTYSTASMYVIDNIKITSYPSLSLFEENFTGGGDWAVVNQPAKWLNLTAEGSGRKWSTINQSTTPPVAFSYNRNTTGADNWLLSAQPLNLTSNTDLFQFEFSFGWGYYVTGEPFRFQVLVTESFDGVDPLKSTWTDITDKFITTVNVQGGGTATLNERVTTPPSGSYPGHRLYTTNLNAFRGKSVYIAFRDKLAPKKTDGTTYSTASMYFIDNIKLTSNSFSLPTILISEVYGGGGDAASTYKSDYIELYNPSESPVDISGWSLQYFDATTIGTSTSSNMTVLPPGTIVPPKAHFLIKEITGSGGINTIFKSDSDGSIDIGTSGKLILYSTNTNQSITNDIASISSNPNFVDYVTFGSTTVPVFGSALGEISSTTAAVRKTIAGRYFYSKNIGNDFSVSTPTPQFTRNYRSAKNGNWSDLSTWEFTDNGTWGNATRIPGIATNVEILKNHEVILNSNLSVSELRIAPGGKLTLNDPFSFNPGTFVIESDITGTGSFADKRTGESLPGITADVEQFLPSASERVWWYLSSPVTNATASVFGSNKIGKYDEVSRMYSNPFVPSAELDPGKGYVVAITNPSPNTYTFQNKILTTGNITVPLTRSITGLSDNKRGFNLVGNPYASYLNWNMVYNASENIRSSIWYRTKVGNDMDFQTYNASLGVSVPSGANGYIPPMQSFWVKVDTDPISPSTTSDGSLTITNLMRSHGLEGVANPLKAPAVKDDLLIRISVSDGNSEDELVVASHPEASDSYDMFDSEKIAIESVNRFEVFSLVGSNELAINGISTLTENREIVLGWRPKKAGAYTMSVKEIINPGNFKIALVDKTDNIINDITLNRTYSFISDAVSTNDRFNLRLNVTGEITAIDNETDFSTSVSVNALKQICFYTSKINNEEFINLYNSIGQKVASKKIEGNLTLLDKTFSSGVYVLSFKEHTYKVIID